MCSASVMCALIETGKVSNLESLVRKRTAVVSPPKATRDVSLKCWSVPGLVRGLSKSEASTFTQTLTKLCFSHAFPQKRSPAAAYRPLFCVVPSPVGQDGPHLSAGRLTGAGRRLSHRPCRCPGPAARTRQRGRGRAVASSRRALRLAGRRQRGRAPRAMSAERRPRSGRGGEVRAAAAPAVPCPLPCAESLSRSRPGQELWADASGRGPGAAQQLGPSAHGCPYAFPGRVTPTAPWISL